MKKVKENITESYQNLEETDKIERRKQIETDYTRITVSNTLENINKRKLNTQDQSIKDRIE